LTQIDIFIYLNGLKRDDESCFFIISLCFFSGILSCRKSDKLKVDSASIQKDTSKILKGGYYWPIGSSLRWKYSLYTGRSLNNVTKSADFLWIGLKDSIRLAGRYVFRYTLSADSLLTQVKRTFLVVSNEYDVYFLDARGFQYPIFSINSLSNSFQSFLNIGVSPQNNISYYYFSPLLVQSIENRSYDTYKSQIDSVSKYFSKDSFSYHSNEIYLSYQFGPVRLRYIDVENSNSKTGGKPDTLIRDYKLLNFFR